MPRTSRASQGGYVYHVLNRGNGRADVFHKDDDFAAFVRLMREAHEKFPEGMLESIDRRTAVERLIFTLRVGSKRLDVWARRVAAWW